MSAPHDPAWAAAFLARPMGQVYVLAARQVGLVKIGMSADTGGRRIAGLKSQNAAKLDVVEQWYVRGPAGLEARLHCEFAARRHHGEWFAPPSMKRLRAVVWDFVAHDLKLRAEAERAVDEALAGEIMDGMIAWRKGQTVWHLAEFDKQHMRFCLLCRPEYHDAPRLRFTEPAMRDAGRFTNWHDRLCLSCEDEQRRRNRIAA